MNEKNYLSEILMLIRSNESPKMMALHLLDYHENDLADAFLHLTTSERQKVCRILDATTLANVFEYLEPEDASHFLEEIDIHKASAIASEMESDDLAEVLRTMGRDRKSLIIQLMDEDAKADLSILSTYDEDEIGSHMTMNYISIDQGISVKEAMKELVDQAADNDNLMTLFVVDTEKKFYGAISLQDLIRARQNSDLEDLIVTSYPYVYGHENTDECVEKLKDYSEDSIPVLDDDNHLLGAITSSTMMELIDAAYGEDYARLAGLTAEEDLEEPLLESIKKRLPWLLVLLGLGVVVSSVVGLFEAVVSQLTIIMAFQSLILDMSGNVGTQSLAVTIRVLMDENLTGRQKLQLVGKEMRVGASNGLILGVLSFLALGVYIMVFKGKTATFAFTVSGCIGISLLIAMIVSSIVGTIIPLFFKKIHVDPAVASGPLITTMNDLVAVICYYGLSWILLLQILHLA